MTSHETAITERLRDAAGRIPVDVDASPIVQLARTPTPRRSTRRRSLIIGFAVATGAAAAIVTVQYAPSTETLEAGPVATAGPGQPRTPSSQSIAPHVISPPDWFGQPEGAYRDVWSRTGRWMSTVIGRLTGDTITEPIAISVFDGTYELLDNAEAVTIDGTSVRSVRLDGWDGWELLATDDTPTVMVSGFADRQTLLAVLNAVEVLDPSGEFTLRLRSRPDGYTDVVSPRVLGQQTTPGRVLASGSGDASIDDVSDMSDPLLAAAFGGANITAVDVDGETGWIGQMPSSPYGPLPFLIWSPQPGVVFQISTDDTSLEHRDLIDLAVATTAVALDEWDAIYAD